MHEVGTDRAGRVLFFNTKYSCLATLDLNHSFRPIWKPPFISKLAPEDRCHLNGMAIHGGRGRYVAAISRSDIVNGGRERRHEGGPPRSPMPLAPTLAYAAIAAAAL